MASSAVTRRIHYLDSASQCLLTISPAISAHLRLVRNNVAENGDRNSTQESNCSCSACGSMLLPGWTCESVRDSAQKRTRKDRLTKQKPDLKVIKWKCSRCNVVTTIEALKPERRQTVKPRSSRAADAAQADTTVDKPTVSSQLTLSTQQTSKKRGRSKKLSLQSILANQKKPDAKQSEGFGLNLMDIMKG